MIKHLPLCRKAKGQVSLSKNRSLRTSPQTGVAISQLFRPEIDRFNLKTGGFPRQCAHWLGMTVLLFVHFFFSETAPFVS